MDQERVFEIWVFDCRWFLSCVFVWHAHFAYLSSASEGSDHGVLKNISTHKLQ